MTPETFICLHHCDKLVDRFEHVLTTLMQANLVRSVPIAHADTLRK